MRTNNKFKNIRKSLRKNSNVSVLPLLNNSENKIKPSNCYDCLDDISCEINISTKNNVDIRTDKLIHNSDGYTEVNFDSLPEDTINIILQYLPIDIRLKIIKNKYGEKNIRVKLQNISNVDINKMFTLAKKSQEILNYVFKNESQDVTFSKLSTSVINRFTEEKELDTYLDFYINKFMEKILSAIKHYSKIYKKNIHPTKVLYGNQFVHDAYRLYTNDYNIQVIEEMIFSLYSHIILISVHMD